MKRNYKITIEYDGTDFIGWQRQLNKNNSIQEIIENNITIILKEEIKIIGAGRTDSGVHAYNQVANFKTDNEIEKKSFIYSLNSILPKSITIKNISEVDDKFHSRYSAKKREYIYKMTTKNISIERMYYHKLLYDIDFNVIDKFIKFLIGNKNFKSLCKNSDDKHNFFCNIEKLEYSINKSKGTIIFKIVANRFLHSMVRAIIGCLIDLGRGKILLDETKYLFANGLKIKTTYLPSNALFLNKIYY